MNRKDIEMRVSRIFHELFSCDPESITKDTSPDNLPGWDSLQHLNLVTSIEAEFQISLDHQDVVDSLSFGLIVQIIEDNLSLK